MSTLLVRHVRHRIFPGGGPFGYLDSLRESLRLQETPPDVRIVVEERPEIATGVLVPAASRLRRLLERAEYKLQLGRRSEAELRMRSDLRRDRAAFEAVDASLARTLFECDLLFVHDLLLAERLVKVAPGEASRKAVLLTHAPTFYAEQWISGLAPERDLEESRRLPWVRREIEGEMQVLRSVRAVAWPLAEARAGYPEWLQGPGAGAPMLVPSGVPRPTASAPRAAIRARWNVGETDRVVLFMGRPHPHKGFDRFAAWARAARGSGLVFLFAGKDAPWPGLDRSGVVSVGYEADPAAAYVAADLVAFPNRKAYLDFGLLQCLSLGVPLLVSPTGGHAAVLRDCPAIPALEAGPPERELAQIQRLLDGGLDPDYRERVARLWEDRFSPRPFVEGHARAVRALLGAAG